jgi:hypothetical protein
MHQKRQFLLLCVALLVGGMMGQTLPAYAQAAITGGTAYRWGAMATATAVTNQTATAALNDGNTTTDVQLWVDTGSTNYQAAGLIWGTAQSIGSFAFVQGGANTSSGDGWFDANIQVQGSTDGTTWSVLSGWSLSPAYAYSWTQSGVTFTFSGATQSLRGIRVVGQERVGTASWWAILREVTAYAPAPTPTFTATNTPTNTPTNTATNTPTNTPTKTNTPTNTPTNTLTGSPTTTPTGSPTTTPTGSPTTTPTGSPTNTPTGSPTNTPTGSPTNTPTPMPTCTAPWNAASELVTVVDSGDLYRSNLIYPFEVFLISPDDIVVGVQWLYTYPGNISVNTTYPGYSNGAPDGHVFINSGNGGSGHIFTTLFCYSHAGTSPVGTAIPLPSALPTILPDQSLAALPLHSQAVVDLAAQPAGWLLVSLLFLWLGLQLLLGLGWPRRR